MDHERIAKVYDCGTNERCSAFFVINVCGRHELLDEFGSYRAAARSGDGLRLWGDGSALRVARGGDFVGMSEFARSGSRSKIPTSYRDSRVGLRPARSARRTE